MLDNSLENYMLKQITELTAKRVELMKRKGATYNFGGVVHREFPEMEYWSTFYTLSGKINILYQCLTAHDNKYDELKLEEEKRQAELKSSGKKK